MKNKLLRLLHDNIDRPRSFSVKAEASDVAHVYLYDVIGDWWGIGAAEFVQTLRAVTAPTIHLHINSPGGDVFDARAIATSLKQHSARVVALIEGYAASAATTVALAADEVRIADGAFFMIHNSWTITVGNAADHDEQAALLRQVDGAILADYARKTGKGEDVIRGWMEAETWFTAQQAVEEGFADGLLGEAAAENRWNLAAYSNAPAPAAKAPAQAGQYDREKYERRLALLARIAG